jgi:hypothetical protein
MTITRFLSAPFRLVGRALLAVGRALSSPFRAQGHGTYREPLLTQGFRLFDDGYDDAAVSQGQIAPNLAVASIRALTLVSVLAGR